MNHYDTDILWDDFSAVWGIGKLNDRETVDNEWGWGAALVESDSVGEG